MLATRSHYYHFFGWFAVLYLFLFYFIMTVAIFPESRDKGRVIAHVLFLKTPALMIYPSYSELIDFCSGFMIADLPWFNQFFGNALSDPRDSSPLPYRLFFVSMNLPSTFFLPLIAVVGLFLVLGFVACNFEFLRATFRNLASFLYCFFLGGISFAVAACVQGGVINFEQEFTVSFSFYLLGLVIASLLLS